MRVILIGVGGFGNVWVNTLKAETQAEVVALVDRDAAALQKAAGILGVAPERCYADLEAALVNTTADALVCVTPPALHREHVVAGLKRGLHVLSEKPMAENREDCQTMLQAARETGKVYAISQNYRYGAGMGTLRAALAKGLIGTIGQVRVEFYKGHDFKGGFRHEMDFPVLVDMSIHHFDLLRYLTGSNAVSVTANAWNPPWSNYRGAASCAVLFQMEAGSVALYNASWCSQGSFCDWNGNWLIEGSLGTLFYENGVVRHYEIEPNYAVRREHTLPLLEPEQTPQRRVFSDFMHAISLSQQPETNCFDNIKSVNMVFGAVEAAKSGARIELT